jgi:hypothetical protein
MMTVDATRKIQSQGFGGIARTLCLIGLLAFFTACQFGTPEPSSDPAELARVTVNGAGLHKITARGLAEMGWTTETPLNLTFNGNALPYQIRGGDLLFYLPDTTPARYSQVHTLWLSPEASQAKAALQSGDAAITRLMGIARLGGEEQYSTQHPGDPWFWRTIAGPTSESFTIPTPNRQEGEVKITLNVAGVTKVTHTIGVTVGEQSLGELTWDGTPRYSQTLNISLPAAEEVALVLNVPEGTNGVDISMIDNIMVEYPSAPARNNGNGIFYGMSASEGQATFEGVGTTPVAWQVSPDLAALSVAADSPIVAIPANGTVMVADPGVATDAQISRSGDLALPTEGADYIAIVDPTLQETLSPLLEYHRGEGLSVASFTPQQVYDAYSDGTVDPLAFRDMLKDGFDNWQTKPRFILLVGDSTYDPSGFLNDLPPTYVPSPFVNSVYGGETVSDNVIADVDEDGYPDVALGRLPARTAAQLETIINKTVQYSQNPAEGEWRSRVLFAADGREALFRETSERLRDTYLPSGVEAVSVYPEAASDALSQMMPQLSEGSFIVNYVGHGSVQQWGRDKLLTTEAVSEITNGNRLPIYINMTCLTGLFSHPNQESLAETLLWSNAGGSVAAIAPTSLTLPTSQSRLNSALLEELLSPERPTIGEALMTAKKAVTLSGANEHDIVATFNLLGDPALRPAPLPNYQ